MVIIIYLVSLENLIVGNWLHIILDDENNSELENSFISLKFVGRKR